MHTPHSTQVLRSRPIAPPCRDLQHACQAYRSFGAQIPALVALIIGIFSVSASQASNRTLQAEKLYCWSFQRAEDANFNSMPDGWKRRLDRQHPAYIEMRIQPRDAQISQAALAAQSTLSSWLHAWEVGYWDTRYVPEAPQPQLLDFLDRTVLDNCLEIAMDGGAAELVGPKFRIDERFSYSLSAEVQCAALDGHTAWIELHFMDDTSQVTQVLSTNVLQGDEPWQRVTTEVVSPANAKTVWGQIHLKVKPHDSTQLAGTVRFDSICIFRMPRISLSTPLRYHVAEPGETFEVQCTAMGIREHEGAQVMFELCDHLGRKLDQELIPLHAAQTEAARLAQARKTDAEGRPYYAVSKTRAENIFDGQAAWSLTLNDPGLYRVRVNLGEKSHRGQHREILVGVIPKDEVLGGGAFGWSLPEFDSQLQPADVPALVRRFGAGWVKIPVWFDITNTQEADRLVTLVERLQAAGSECVGRLDDPPPALRENFGDVNEKLYAVNYFSDPSRWEPHLEPVLTRMGMKVTWFQLGGDDDNSFFGNENLTELMSNIRARMQTYSQELKLALAWNWLDASPNASAPPWNALHFSVAPQLTANELRHFTMKPPAAAETWVSLNPLDGDAYPLLDRVRDLTERMIAIKQSSATIGFVTNPFNPRWRLIKPNQTLDEMLVPWRNLVANLGNAIFVGSIELPKNSANYVFQKGDLGIMLVWNDNTRIEQTFLGENIQITDIWGKPLSFDSVEIRPGAVEQSFAVSPWPIIIHGVDVDVVRFRQAFQLQVDNLVSQIGSEVPVPVHMENALPFSAAGKLAMVSPSLLKGGRAEVQVQLPSARGLDMSIPAYIRNDASAGSHQLRFDFDLVAGKPYRFSLYRSLKLGAGDVELVWEVIRKNADSVELRVEVENQTSEVLNFDCKLFPPGKPYQRFQLRELPIGKSQQDVPVFISEEAEEREVWLRCEQIGSGRILNYRLKM